MEEKTEPAERAEYKMPGVGGVSDRLCQIPYGEDLDAALIAHGELLRAMCKHYGMDAHGRLMCTAALHAIHALMLNREMDVLGTREEPDGEEGQAQ